MLSASGHLAALWGIAANLLLFGALTSLPAFREAHHHWIFPLLAALFALEWALSGGFSAPEARPGPAAQLRSLSLSLLALLPLAGVIRHQTILACFGNCSLKLAAAAALAGAVFLLHASRGEAGFWRADRCSAAGGASLAWAAFLLLYGLGLTRWAQDLVMLAGWGLLLPLRRRPWARPVVAGLPVLLLLRRHAGEGALIAAGLAAAAAVLALASPRARRG